MSSLAFLRYFLTQTGNRRQPESEAQRRAAARRLASAEMQRFHEEEELKLKCFQGPTKQILVHLPLELSLYCLSFSSVYDLSILCQVSLYHRILSNDCSLWKSHCFQQWRKQWNFYSLITEEEWKEMEEEKEEENNGKSMGERGGKNFSSFSSSPGPLNSLDDQEEPRANNERTIENSSSSYKEEGNEEKKLDPLRFESSIPRTPFLPSSHGFHGWKHRYLASQMDFHRVFLTLTEITQIRWHFQLRSPSNSFFPAFSSDFLMDMRGGIEEVPLEYKFIDIPRSFHRPSKEFPTSPYEKAGFLTAEKKKLWLMEEKIRIFRESGGKQGNSRQEEENNKEIIKEDQQEKKTISSSSSPSSQISLFCDRLEADFPPSRYPIGFDFLSATQEILDDLRMVRRVQVAAYPPLKVSRTENGGWRMENSFVIFTSLQNGENEEEIKREEERRWREIQAIRQDRTAGELAMQEDSENEEEDDEDDEDDDNDDDDDESVPDGPRLSRRRTREEANLPADHSEDGGEPDISIPQVLHLLRNEMRRERSSNGFSDEIPGISYSIPVPSEREIMDEAISEEETLELFNYIVTRMNSADADSAAEENSETENPANGSGI